MSFQPGGAGPLFPPLPEPQISVPMSLGSSYARRGTGGLSPSQLGPRCIGPPFPPAPQLPWPWPWPPGLPWGGGPQLLGSAPPRPRGPMSPPGPPHWLGPPGPHMASSLGLGAPPQSGLCSLSANLGCPMGFLSSHGWFWLGACMGLLSRGFHIPLLSSAPLLPPALAPPSSGFSPQFL
jgi:hypothetical protein